MPRRLRRWVVYFREAPRILNGISGWDSPSAVACLERALDHAQQLFKRLGPSSQAGRMWQCKSKAARIGAAEQEVEGIKQKDFEKTLKRNGVQLRCKN